MKEYIAPVAKSIDLLSEGSLMTLSDQMYNTASSCDIDASNQRGASESIWGFDE